MTHSSPTTSNSPISRCPVPYSAVSFKQRLASLPLPAGLPAEGNDLDWRGTLISDIFRNVTQKSYIREAHFREYTAFPIMSNFHGIPQFTTFLRLSAPSASSKSSSSSLPLESQIVFTHSPEPIHALTDLRGSEQARPDARTHASNQAITQSTTNQSMQNQTNNKKIDPHEKKKRAIERSIGRRRGAAIELRLAHTIKNRPKSSCVV